jgi:hypothetical protein
MKYLLAAALVVGGCGTKRATIAHATLSIVSLGGGVLARSHDCGSQSHSECDRLGPQIVGAFLIGTGVAFGIAAVVSYALTPDDEP